MAEAAREATTEEEAALRELAELAGDMPRAEGRLDQGATQSTAEAPAPDLAGPAEATSAEPPQSTPAVETPVAPEPTPAVAPEMTPPPGEPPAGANTVTLTAGNTDQSRVGRRAGRL
jgi:hypothetical protein